MVWWSAMLAFPVLAWVRVPWTSNWASIVSKKKCVGRESNPDQLLGRQLCWPLYHRRLLTLWPTLLRVLKLDLNTCDSNSWMSRLLQRQHGAKSRDWCCDEASLQSLISSSPLPRQQLLHLGSLFLLISILQFFQRGFVMWFYYIISFLPFINYLDSQMRRRTQRFH